MNQIRRSISVLDAPSNLGLRPPQPGREPGVYRLADALRRQALVRRLGALDGGRIIPPAYSPDPDPETRFRNGKAIGEFSPLLADRVASTIRAGLFPLVLGGDCSILIGNTLGLKSIGRYGLVYLDGHTDFSYPHRAQAFAAAGLDLALVTGRGPKQLANIRGLGPYVRDEDVVLFGNREIEDPAVYDTQALRDSAIKQYGLERVRELGPAQAARQAVAAIERNGIEGFWIHLDADVLNPEVMPAVDCPDPGGLSYDELIAVLRVFLSSGRAVGMEITIFDPELDPNGSIAAQFTDAIVAAFLDGSPAG